MTKQPYAAQVCCLMVSTPAFHAITLITTHLLTLKGREAELAWLADPKWTLYTRSGHMSTIDQAPISESPKTQPKTDVLTNVTRCQTEITTLSLDPAAF